MMVGDPERFAVESAIDIAYENLGLRALGWFRLYVSGRTFGRCEPCATLLANVLDSVSRRLGQRGRHTFEKFGNLTSVEVARGYLSIVYARGFCSSAELERMGLSGDMDSTLMSLGLDFALDGDEAFDDGSNVLHLDEGDTVRIIAFKNEIEEAEVLATVRELRMPAEEFYGTLATWRKSFADEWQRMPKNPSALLH